MRNHVFCCVAKMNFGPENGLGNGMVRSAVCRRDLGRENGGFGVVLGWFWGWFLRCRKGSVKTGVFGAAGNYRNSRTSSQGGVILYVSLNE